MSGAISTARTTTAQQRQPTAPPAPQRHSSGKAQTATTTQTRHITKHATLEVVSIGTISASLVHPREVFKGAILNNAAAVIIAHNHPSGDTTPSAEDKEATRRIQRAGELMGIPLLDHMVLADKSFFSFKEAGIM